MMYVPPLPLQQVIADLLCRSLDWRGSQFWKSPRWCSFRGLSSKMLLKHMGVSKNSGFSPKSSILIGFSIINHPFWGITIFGNIHMESKWMKLMHLGFEDFNQVLCVKVWRESACNAVVLQFFRIAFANSVRNGKPMNTWKADSR